MYSFLASLGAGVGGSGSHQTDQNQRWYFVWWSEWQPESQKAHVNWMLVVSVVMRAEHNACYLLVVLFACRLKDTRTEMCSPLSNIGELVRINL
jgi:hypothetical protein